MCSVIIACFQDEWRRRLTDDETTIDVAEDAPFGCAGVHVGAKVGAEASPWDHVASNEGTKAENGRGGGWFRCSLQVEFVARAPDSDEDGH